MEKMTALERQRERFITRASRTANKYLQRMKEQSGLMDELTPFFKTLEDIYAHQKNINGQSKKLVGTYCVMAPQELIYAAGAQPVKLCSGCYTAFAIGEDIVARDACPLVKSVAGYANIGTMPIYDECELMIVPITCDCKKK